MSLKFLLHDFVNWSPDASSGASASDGAAAPAPAATPPASVTPTPAAPSSASASASSSDGDVFDMPLGDDDDVVVLPQAGGVSPPATPEPGVVTQPPIPTQLPAPQGQVAQPQAAPAAPVPASQQPEPATQAPPDFSNPEVFTQALTQNRDVLTDYLAKNVFALTEADAEELRADPAAAAPKLGAKIYLQAVAAVHKQIQTFVPQLIEQHMRQSQVFDSAEKKFFEAFPDIGREHDALVVSAAQRYRAMFPDATLDKTIADVGTFLRANLGLKAPAPTPAATPKLAKQAPAFTPANGGSPPTGGKPSDQNDPWANFTLPDNG